MIQNENSGPLNPSSPPMAGYQGGLKTLLFTLLGAGLGLLLFLAGRASQNSGVKKFKKAMKDKDNELSELYLTKQKTKAQYQGLLSDVADIYLFARGWTEAPPELIEPFQCKLQETLASQDVEEFSPEIGKKAPDGCQKEPADAKVSGKSGTVVEVLEIGLKLKKQNLILKKPIVKVIPERSKK